MSSISQAESTPAAMCFQPERYVVLIVCALAVALLLMPLAVIDVPLIADYPNHVARMHILGNIDTDELLADRYQADIDFIPNIAMDLVVPRLAGIMPLDLAGRLFLALTLLSTLASVAFLHRILFNRWCISSLMALLFLYHGSFMAGMVNFSLGIGLVPAALGLWIAMRHGAIALRVAIGSAVALVLFFCHLVAFGAYGLLILTFEGISAREAWHRTDGRYRACRHVLIAGMTGLLPTLLFARQLLDGHQVNAAVGALSWESWSWKAKALLAPLANYDLALDLASLTFLAGLAVWALCTSRLLIDRRMVPGLVLLAFGFALAPKALLTGGVFDQRLAILFALIFVGSVRWRVEGTALRLGLFTALAVLFLVRLGVVTATWIDHRRDLSDMRAAISEVDRGARILVAQPDRTAGIRQAPARHIAFHHAAQLASLPTLAVIEKSAFVSTIYAIPGQQPLRLSGPFRDLGGHGAVLIPTLAELADAVDRPGTDARPEIQSWRQDFDYVLLIYGYGKGAERLRGNLPLNTLRDGAIVDLFEIEAE